MVLIVHCSYCCLLCHYCDCNNSGAPAIIKQLMPMPWRGSPYTRCIHGRGPNPGYSGVADKAMLVTPRKGPSWPAGVARVICTFLSTVFRISQLTIAAQHF